MDGRGMIVEGHSTSKPPYFDRSNYTYWKHRMQVFLRAKDYEIWKVVSKGSLELSPNEDVWTKEEIRRSTLNWSAINTIQCSLHPSEFSRISACSSVKEIWDALEVIYKGTSQVRETKTNLLVSEYEAFKMKPNETIKEMCARLTVITNGLRDFGKRYSEYDIVRKILRSLTPIWHTKTTVMEESRDLHNTRADELIGSLMAYEMNMPKIDEADRRKKSIALKAGTNISNRSSLNGSSSEESLCEEEMTNDDIAMITKEFRRFLKKEGGKFK